MERRGGMLAAVTDVGDDELRVRLHALRVFDVELPAFDTDRTPEDPAELPRDWLLEAIEAGVRAGG